MKAYIPALSVLFFLFSGCGGSKQELHFVSIKGTVFGTYYTVSYYAAEDTVYDAAIDSLFAVFNQSLSYYENNSLISRINRNETDSVDDFFRVVFNRAMAISEETGGALDVTVSPVVNAWGFGFQKRDDVTSALIDSLMGFVGYKNAWLDGNRLVKADPRVQFDFNAIAKGYASDVVAQLLESKGIDIYLVEIGGDLVVKGEKPDGSSWKIGLERPAKSMFDSQEWDYLVELKDLGLATSGSYRRYYESDGQRYSHTIDPQTGYPVVHNLLSVSVFAADGMSADAYATAFMVMGLEKARTFVNARDDLQAYFIFSDGADAVETYATPGLTLIPRK